MNEKVRLITAAFSGSSRELVITCECASIDCADTIYLTPDAHDAVRRNPLRFIVRPGHVFPEVEYVVEEAGTYVVVEKFGAAVPIAEALAPDRDAR
ncbi:MAG TPA: hypothetical protein VNT58_03435 [Gaiellaceae bacterium]|nr:hypothetical protein [Gaiellaceae bacterium]